MEYRKRSGVPTVVVLVLACASLLSGCITMTGAQVGTQRPTLTSRPTPHWTPRPTPLPTVELPDDPFGVEPDEVDPDTPGLAGDTDYEERCRLRLRGHDATVTFTGFGAIELCSRIQRIAGRWRETEVVPEDAVLSCKGENAGITWRVMDTGGHLYGGALCDGLVQWQNGGTLEIP